MSGMPDIICAACGGDLTRGREFWDNASILRPLLSVEVLPCTTCLSRAAEMAGKESREAGWEEGYKDAIDTAKGE